MVRRSTDRCWGSATVFASRTISADASGPLLDAWVIREIDAHGIPGAVHARCLVFENDAVVRRIWRYPADWSALSDDAVLALMDARAAG
jgi:hypothetical protein